MKKSLTLVGLLAVSYANAQYAGKVGINTETPKATLQVKATTDDATKGILIPQLTGDELKQMTANLTQEQHSMLVFVTAPITDNTAAGFENIILPAYYRFNYDETKATAYQKTWVRVEPSGLEKIKQNNKTGWRLIDADPTQYVDIGTNAVDLSINNSTTARRGAAGEYSFATGYQTTASGFNSTAMGYQTTASGHTSTAMGYQTTASGINSTAMGPQTTASGTNSTAMGYQTTASGLNSTAMGNQTAASGTNSTAMGYKTTALGSNSTAIGNQTAASGLNSTAMGYKTTALGSNSTAMGYKTTALGSNSTAIGNQTTASGTNSTAMGEMSNTQGRNSIAAGWDSNSNGFASVTIGSHLINNVGNSLVIGHYNHSLTDTDSYWNNNTLLYTFTTNDMEAFVIGNGTTPTNKKNAFVVLKDGKTGIGVAQRKPLEMLEVEGNIKINGTNTNITAGSTCPNVGTITFSNDNFYGCKSSGWVLLNN